MSSASSRKTRLALTEPHFVNSSETSLGRNVSANSISWYSSPSATFCGTSAASSKNARSGDETAHTASRCSTPVSSGNSEVRLQTNRPAYATENHFGRRTPRLSWQSPNRNILHNAAPGQRSLSPEMKRQPKLLDERGERGVNRRDIAAFAKCSITQRTQPIRLAVFQHALVAHTMSPQINCRHYAFLMDKAHDVLYFRVVF